MPKVSVILPVYNVGPYLDETLDSLTQQTLKDIEIIAVNDGSTDDSEDILKKHQIADSRISYFNQRNQGQSVARNLALQHATGDYIYMMDADDSIVPDALQQCYDYAERTQADFIFFDGDSMLEEGAQPLTWNYHRTHLCEEGIPYHGDDLLNKMLDTEKHNCVVWLLLIRKSYLDSIGLSFYPGIIHEDELFTTILTLKSHRIYCLQQRLVQHRVRRASTMGKRYSKRNISCYLTVIDELLKFHDSALIRKYARYTLSKVFYTGHILPLRDKVTLFARVIRSGYLKYIGLKSTLVFWLKQ